MEFGGPAITALAELIAPAESSDSEDDAPSSYYAKLTPANIGAPKRPVDDPQQPMNETNRLVEKKNDSKDIWDSEEINEGSQFDDIYDTRISPEYDIVYKQSVATEDMFLGMSNKTPATSSCEDMLINIKLPGQTLKDINVDLTDRHLAVRSPKYKLGLHLPHPCDSKNGRAQWIEDKQTLKITVRMKRDYDFVNF